MFLPYISPIMSHYEQKLFIHSYRLTGSKLMFSLKPKYKMWRIFDQLIGTFLYFFLCSENFILYHNKRLLCADTCCHSVMKEFAHAFSCAYIESWMHLGSLESTQKARVTLSCASSYSYAFFMLSKLPACSHNLIYTQ